MTREPTMLRNAVTWLRERANDWIHAYVESNHNPSHNHRVR